MAKAGSRTLWDKVGATASAICAVHCALNGVALGLMSSLGLGFFSNPWLDVAFIGIALSVGLIALVHGIRKHGSWGPSSLYALGSLAVISVHAHLLEDLMHHEHHQHSAWTTALSVMAGLCFVGFHVWNLRLQHRHDERCSCHHPVCEHGS